MKILILNFRDLYNPYAGGSEVVTHEVAKRWVAWGHQVTLFAPTFPGAKAEEEVDGVKIIRRGGRYTVYLQAWLYYRQHLRGQFDVVIDEINTIPFFARFYAGVPVITWFHQLARRVWFYEARFPISLIGYLSEPWHLRLYRKYPAMAMSISTAQDLLNLGFKRVWILPEAISVQPVSNLQPKSPEPILLFVGRVVPSKRVHEAVKAMPEILKEFPQTKLWIVGGLRVMPYAAKLWRLVQKLGLTSKVRIYGQVPAASKWEKMKQATLLLVTSVREGWGLVVTEANVAGTPAVVYDVHGLRDSVRNGETGIVCQKNNPQELAKEVIKLLKDRNEYERLRRNAWEWSKEFSWDKTAQQAMEFTEKVLAERKN